MHSTQIGHVIKVESGRTLVRLTTTEHELTRSDRTYRIGRLGSYVSIPLAERTLIGFVTGIDRLGGEGQCDLGNMQVQLLGEIEGDRFKRGVNEYPVLDDPVHLATQDDFAVIFGSLDKSNAADAKHRSFTLGRFAFDTEFDVRIMGSQFFAKHVAVLGNSGSGKSCTTAKILQELLELEESRTILFDMHGEYRAAFSDGDGRLRENVTYLGVEDIVLPYWLLKYEELEALFVDRSNPLNVSTQISFLRTALLEFKQDAAQRLGLTQSLTLDTPIYFSLEHLKIYAENLNDARYVLNDDHLAMSQLALRSLPPEEQQKLMRRQRCQFNRGNPEGETPHPLYFGKLLGLIDLIDTRFNDRRYEFLLKPIEHGRKSHFFRDQIAEMERTSQTSNLMNHLIKVLIGRGDTRSNLTIIDLSGIPFEIVDITVAVLTRLLFDLNFWTPSKRRHPILLAFEEAHNYIPRVPRGQAFAQKAVERVAKEGRKYGVSAMVISQRPSELSETVLAQCNSFVVMRISNPEDQHYASKVVGDHFAGVMDMLPVLRPGEAFVLGDSVVMPMRTLVTMPNPAPDSGDMDFFKLWSTIGEACDVDEIINHWRRQDRRAASKLPEEPPPDPAPPVPSVPVPMEPAAPAPANPPGISGMMKSPWLVKQKR